MRVDDETKRLYGETPEEAVALRELEIQLKENMITSTVCWDRLHHLKRHNNDIWQGVKNLWDVPVSEKMPTHYFDGEHFYRDVKDKASLTLRYEVDNDELSLMDLKIKAQAYEEMRKTLEDHIKQKEKGGDSENGSKDNRIRQGNQ